MQQSFSRLPMPLLIFLLATAFGESGYSQERVTIVFQLHAPELKSDTDVFITGSVNKLGKWNPGQVRMKPLGDHRWSYQIESEPGLPIEYKYTLGSWTREGANADGNALQNFVIDVATDATIKDSIMHWTTGQQRNVTGQITGAVRYHRQLTFDGLLPRDVIVWLPPGYDSSDDRCGVLYMQDGQNIVDPATSSFGTDWQVDETLTRLIENGECSATIVVGIYCTAERSKDYAPGEQGDRYLDFVCEKIKPFIDDLYRTKSDRESTFVAGSSLGGTSAFRLAWERSELFSAAICMSPAFFKRDEHHGTGNLDYFANVQRSEVPKPTPFLYLDNGGIGLEKRLQPGIDAMVKALQQKGLQPDKDFVFRQFPDASHNESAWAARMPDALKLLAKPGTRKK